MLKALLFFCLVVIAVAKEKTECEIKHNVNEEDWNALRADPTKPSEKMLCMFKCKLHETDGTVNSEGVLDVEKYMEQVGRRITLTEDDKTSIRECCKSTAPIKTCADVNAPYNCVQKIYQAKRKACTTKQCEQIYSI